MFKLFRKFRFERALSRAYYVLSVVQNLFFDNYLKQEDILKQYKKLNKQHRKFYKYLKHIRRLITKNTNEQHKLDQIEKVHEITCAIHLLRFRVNDRSVFEICSHEMFFLQKTATQLLKKCSKQTFNLLEELQALEYSIQAFETINTNTLQIVSRDPVIFQYFIQDLYALHQWGCDYENIFKKQ